MSRQAYKGEKRYIGMTVNRRDTEAVVVASATYEIRNAAGTVVQSGGASIDGAEVFCLFDTTPEAIVADGNYYVWFEDIVITGLPKVLKGRVLVEVLAG